MSVNIFDALTMVAKDKAEYFKWKFDIRFEQALPRKTEQEFCTYMNRHTLDAYIKWERSTEYKDLVALYLQSRTANVLVDVFEKVAKAATEGDEKAVKLFLVLDKEIREHAKIADKTFAKEEKSKPEDDGLVIK